MTGPIDRAAILATRTDSLLHSGTFADRFPAADGWRPAGYVVDEAAGGSLAGMTDVTGDDVINLHQTDTLTNAVLTDHDGAVSVAERTTCRAEGWPILIYRSDLVEAWPNGLTPQQAQDVADQINAARAAGVAGE